VKEIVEEENKRTRRQGAQILVLSKKKFFLQKSRFLGTFFNSYCIRSVVLLFLEDKGSDKIETVRYLKKHFFIK
jgi:hypothetical protein